MLDVFDYYFIPPSAILLNSFADAQYDYEFFIAQVLHNHTATDVETTLLHVFYMTKK